MKKLIVSILLIISQLTHAQNFGRIVERNAARHVEFEVSNEGIGMRLCTQGSSCKIMGLKEFYSPEDYQNVLDKINNMCIRMNIAGGIAGLGIVAALGGFATDLAILVSGIMGEEVSFQTFIGVGVLTIISMATLAGLSSLVSPSKANREAVLLMNEHANGQDLDTIIDEILDGNDFYVPDGSLSRVSDMVQLLFDS